ncbi:ABC-type transport system, ATPase and permease components [Alteracholeplasma palmae J233]|uniref:ABC-type transport system, ATPase and permease components n=1 Tax=Alteracholeplasma palmae (strain ATCC 49389 / J233) TaxID=1318466 RepID=U4KJJ8_ALTPJ|nr:ABC transporter ATP-binding protein/permease [Alteracholeplasma palmae]CCV63639.1 ABC-type transport system, ATPase and permease components [Alteracholeplasma palmae J233]
MLTIKNIKKAYQVGEEEVFALKGINLSFRQKEFVSILGQSGSGKTTLLNIIGGLDKYTSGDLIVDGVSTKNYKDKDWDAYRNHRIGFVFQSYNLIPHLTVLNNVELALTLSGVNAKERKEKATKVLTRVGLIDHLNKKPNQLSGGQMQRVAIARALVNEPNIILADEPTGALDSETSVEIMELLKEISHDKLIIMVTHNPNLAKQYSSRTVQLLDGQVVSDTNPYNEESQVAKQDSKNKTSMTFFTALKLSLKNLMTKKVRTIITAFAGSIGIIGVALVLSLQYGFNQYLDKMETDTFSGMPIIVNQVGYDLEKVTTQQKEVENGIGVNEKLSYYINQITPDYINYLETKAKQHTSNIGYVYGFDNRASYKNENGTFNWLSNSSLPSGRSEQFIGEPIASSKFLEEQFLIEGKNIDDNAFEAIVIANRYNRVDEEILKFLGLSTTEVITYDKIIGKTFKLYDNDLYLTKKDGKYSQDLGKIFLNQDKAINVTIVGVAKPRTQFLTLPTQIMYTKKVQEELISRNSISEIVVEQKEVINNATSITNITNLLTGNPFTLENILKVQDVLASIGVSVKLDKTLLKTTEIVPKQINIYPSNFDGKNDLKNVLNAYNEGKEEADKIIFVDQAGFAIGMIKNVMNSISAVLIAFSAISLIVSSVMIGIITYTSVLERTKEIGVLRSIGARKKDISRVFNAESIIIGFLAGTLGVIITYAINPLVSLALESATETSGIANLYYLYAIGLIGVSMLLTFIAGLIPSRIAAKKDPVVALRTE